MGSQHLGGMITEALVCVLLDEAPTPPERCAWCIKEFGWPTGPAGTSHGICARHRQQLMAELERLLPPGASVAKPGAAPVSHAQQSR